MGSSPERGAAAAGPTTPAADDPLAGALAVVTGATGGIGAETVRRLAGAGAEVLVVARSAERVRRLAAEVNGAPLAADVSSPAGVDAVLAAVLARRGAAPDIVVHAAGAFQLAPLAETPVDEFDRMIAVNLRAAFLLVRAFVPAMLERGSGHVVTVGSVAGRNAYPGNGAYSASKFGVRGLHAVLAAELRGTGVRATFVEPAATDTALWDVIDMEATPGLPSREMMLEPAAIADAILYSVTRPRDVAIPNILVERA